MTITVVCKCGARFECQEWPAVCPICGLTVDAPWFRDGGWKKREK